MKKTIKILAITIPILLLVGVGGYKLMNSRDYQVAGEMITNIDTDEKVVFLTFDDGPTKETKKILDVLEELDIMATFFLIGSNIEENKDKAKAIYERGHDIANHTYSHNRMIFKSPKYVKHEIDKTNDLIKELGYDREILFRPPFGKKLFTLPLYLNKINQTTVMWNIEPESYEESSKTPETMAQNVFDNVENGSIILLHPMNDKTDKTVDAIKIIVKELKSQGYSFKLLSEYI